MLISGVVTDGLYQLDLPPAAPETMLELRVRGRAGSGQDFIELAAYVGTVQQMIDEADPDGVARVNQVPTLAVSPESTARYALLAQSMPLAHECALGAAVAQIDPDAMFERAAVIKIMIANGGIPALLHARGTSQTTLGTISDGALYGAAVTAIEGDDPGRIGNLQTTLAEPFCNRFQDGSRTLVTIVKRLTGEWLNVQGGEMFENQTGGQGVHYGDGGKDDFTLECAGDTAEMSFAGDRETPGSWPRIVDGVTVYLPGLFRIVSARLIRVDGDAGYTTVMRERTSAFRFDDPLYGEVSIHTPSEPFAIIRERMADAFDEENLAGEYLLPTSNESAAMTTDRVQLDPGGEGMDLDEGQPITWNVDAEGNLRVQFEGRSAYLIPVKDEAPGVKDVFVIVEPEAGVPTVDLQPTYKMAQSPVWNAGNGVEGQWCANEGREMLSTYYLIFELLDGGAVNMIEAHHSGEYAGQVISRPGYWWQQTGQDVVLRRCRTNTGSGATYVPIFDEPAPGECNVNYVRRSWRLYQPDGHRHYVHYEHAQWSGDPTSGPPISTFSRPQFVGSGFPGLPNPHAIRR